MAKNTKPIPVRKSSGPRRLTALRRGLSGFVAVIVFAAVTFVGIRYLRDYAERKLLYPTAPPHVVLVNRPVWMSDLLAEQIIRSARPMGIHSAFDHQLLVDTANMLAANPWISHVNQVRRAYGQRPGDTLEVDCEYRAPVALVKWGQYFWLVDGSGVKLPEQYTANQLPRIMYGQDQRVNIRIIEGVDSAPVESGKTWPGRDLAAGLELVKLLAGRPYTEEILKVDVSNFGGRRDDKEAQIVLVTKYDPPTEIRWGRAPSAPDYFIEVSAAQKLDAMNRIFQEKSRVDGNEPWIDIRFDRVTCPSPQDGLAQATSR